MKLKGIYLRTKYFHCVKSIRSYSGLHFLAFGMNTKAYSLSLHIQSKYGKIRIRITPNRDTFQAVFASCIIWGAFKCFSVINDSCGDKICFSNKLNAYKNWMHSEFLYLISFYSFKWEFAICCTDGGSVKI